MKTGQKIHAGALILINALLLHFIISSIPLRFDFSAEKSYTLSKNSKSLISKIEEPVTLDFYYTRGNEDLPIQYKNFASRIEQMLKQYVKASKNKLILNILSPEPDSKEEENAIASGLQGASVSVSGDQVYLGLVASQGDVEKTIAFFDINKEDFLEHDLSKLIYEAQLISKPRLGFLSGLPLQAPLFQMPGQPTQQSQYIVESLTSQYDLVTIEETAQSLPEDIDMLMIIHPQALDDQLLFEIDQLILAGKPAFIAVDPSSLLMRSQNSQNHMFGQQGGGNSSTLETLFSTWGLSFDSGNVIADKDLAFTQPGRAEPTWLRFGTENMDNAILPLGELEDLLLLEAGSFSLEESSELELTPLLTSSENVGTINSMMLAFMQPAQAMRQMQASDESFVVAAQLSGTFKTAFPNGKPTSPNNDEEDDNTDNSQDTLTEGKSNVFVIGDTDWLLDQFSLQRQNFLGMTAIQPINNNQQLASNYVDYLAGSEDLIGIRSKGTKTRSFTVVDAMEVEAQQAFQAKLQEMEDQQREIQTQIQEILQTQQGSGLIVASPELEKSLSEFREQEAALNGEIRNIRRNMRSRIENLGTTLATANLLWAPIALTIFGILFFKARKQRKI
ncbi:GldG family protein [Puniceicoccaceae bacterium K14]|nr:GldG family protein [Puniceicoccaceae bacterium K14]